MKKQIISAICAVTMLAAVSAGFATVSAATPTEYVLTANTDETYYPGMSNLNVGLTYTYDGDSQFTNDDPHGQKLIGGNINFLMGDYAIWGYYEGGRPVSVISDTHTSNTYITGADLYRWETDDANGDVSVCISTDGTSYSSEIKATVSVVNGSDGNQVQWDNGRKLYKYTVNFDTPVKGRYIKITSTCLGGDRQQILGEMVIRGYVYDSNSKVLTNNLQPGFDKGLYPNMDNFDIGLTYTMTGSSHGSYSDDKIMTNGSIDDTSGGSSIHCDWDNDITVTIIADAKADVYFTGADLYEFETGDAGVKSISISVSSDGAQYTEIATVSSGTTISTDLGLTKFGKDFEPTRGRYLKIVSNKAEKHKQWLGEIVVKGFPAAFSFGGTKFDSTTNTFSGVLVNAPEVDAVASNVITAVYDNAGRFVAAKTSNVTVDANASQSFSADLSGVTIGSGYSIKSYAWNDSYKYLTSPVEYRVQ